MRVANEHDDFLSAMSCEHCGEALDIRSKSFFTRKVIGRKCMTDEEDIKDRLSIKGLVVNGFYGCGYVPDVSKEPDFLNSHKKLRVEENEE